MLVSLLFLDVEKNSQLEFVANAYVRFLTSHLILIIQNVSLTISSPSSKYMISFDLKRWF